MKSLGLYIHIPFCKKKCIYCDFLSFPAEESVIKEYVKILTEELTNKSVLCRNYTVDTVFFGGGTPSFIPSDCIFALLSCIKANYNLSENAEITIESNPGTLTAEKCETYIRSGINRLSMGLQSSDTSVLKFLERIHSSDDFVKSVDIAKKSGFKNINADIIFGIPGQSLKNAGDTMDLILSQGLTHVSAYSLIIEDGTKLADLIENKTILPPDDGLDRQMYYLIRDRLSASGFRQYEISNFAREGFESRHNLKYWNEEEYLGLGLGASSFFMGRRTKNQTDLNKYINRDFTQTENQFIDENEKMNEYMMLGFRKTEGPSVKGFREMFGKEMFDVFGNKLDTLKKQKLIDTETSEGKMSRVFLTEYGMDFANEVFMEFI